MWIGFVKINNIIRAPEPRYLQNKMAAHDLVGMALMLVLLPLHVRAVSVEAIESVTGFYADNGLEQTVVVDQIPSR